MKSEHEMNRGGGLQINRRVGQAIHIFVAGVEVIIELRQVKGNSAKLGVIADPKKVAIRREEQLEKVWRE